MGGSREAWALGTEASCHAQLCLAPVSPPCPAEGLYLGGATAENDNARARAGHPGARTEWARHQATPGLTVSAINGETGSLENSAWSRRSALGKCPRGGGCLSGDSLSSVIARSKESIQNCSVYRLAPRIWPQHGIAEGDNTLMWPAKQSENNLGHINRGRVSEMREAMVQCYIRGL